MSITDEMLSAYLDGETDAATSAEIEAAIGADPALAARLHVMAENDATLRDAFATVLKPEPQAPAQVVPFPIRPGRPAPLPAWTRLAASVVVALAIGAAAGVVLAPRPASLVRASGAELQASDALAGALSRARSGVAAKARGDVLTVALSFRARDGRLCRQFRLSSEGGASDAIACRGAAGWRIEGWSTAAAQAAGGFETAAGPSNPALDAVAERLGVAQALDARAETRAIADGWR